MKITMIIFNYVNILYCSSLIITIVNYSNILLLNYRFITLWRKYSEMHILHITKLPLHLRIDVLKLTFQSYPTVCFSTKKLFALMDKYLPIERLNN